MAEVEIMSRRSPISTTSSSSLHRGGGGSSTNGACQSQARNQKSSRSCPNTSLLTRTPSAPVESYLSQINEIESGLYLSGARALTPSSLRDLGISCIINVTVELPNVPYALGAKGDTQLQTLKIPIDDSPYANIAYYFERSIDKIDEVLRSGSKVLVHCVAGVSRSATIVIAYLMKHRQMTLRRAYDHVKSCRPIIRPNPGFFRQLIDYETRCFGKSTVRMSWNAAAGGNIPDLYEHEYANTMNFINKYGCYHNNSGGRGEDGGFSRTWPGSASFLCTNRCSR